MYSSFWHYSIQTANLIYFNIFKPMVPSFQKNIKKLPEAAQRPPGLFRQKGSFRICRVFADIRLFLLSAEGERPPYYAIIRMTGPPAGAGDNTNKDDSMQNIYYASEFAALDSHVINGGGTDDTRALQQILDKAKDGRTPVRRLSVRMTGGRRVCA